MLIEEYIITLARWTMHVVLLRMCAFLFITTYQLATVLAVAAKKRHMEHYLKYWTDEYVPFELPLLLAASSVSGNEPHLYYAEVTHLHSKCCIYRFRPHQQLVNLANSASLCVLINLHAMHGINQASRASPAGRPRPIL